MINNKEIFVNRIVKEYPDMKVLWFDKMANKKWSSEKVIKDLSDSEKELFNLRKQFPNEIILDIEEKYKVDEIIKLLTEKNYNYEVWETGSRGIHISIKFNNLADKSLELRNRIRKYFINYYNTDEALSKESQWVALEHSKHFKTGRLKVLVNSINNNNSNFIEKEIIEYCQKDLEEKERRRIENKTIIKDFVKNDEYLNFVLTHTIENGDRNRILFKNLAIGLHLSGLSRSEIEVIGEKIIEHCPGKLLGEFMGWVDKAINGELIEYNKSELIQWSLNRGEEPLYKLESEDDLLDIMTIKQLWNSIWDLNIKFQPIWRDLCFYNMLGTILDEREDDLRIHVMFSSESGTGKDEGVNLVHKVLDSLGCKTKRPAEVTDRTLIGAVNQIAVEYNTKNDLTEDNQERKGKTFKKPIEEGWLADTNWIAFSEAETILLKPSPHNLHIQLILRQAMDKERKVEKGVGGFDIPITTNTSFIFTTYKMNAVINAILNNGLFQRTLFYDKDLTQEEHEGIIEYVCNKRFGTKSDKELFKKYFYVLIEKLKAMKKWYYENKKDIVSIENMNKLAINLWKNAGKEYSFLMDMDRRIIESMSRRTADIVYRLSLLSCVAEQKTKIDSTDIRDAFKLIMECLSSISTLVIGQDKNRKKIYMTLKIVYTSGSISKMQLHYELQNKLKMKSTATRSEFIKYLITQEYLTTFKDGRTDMLLLTDKGQNYLTLEQ